MRKLAYLLAAPAVVLAMPAAAQDVYVGVSGGLSLPEDSANRGRFTSDVAATPDYPAIASGTPLAWTTRFKSGFNISGQIGARFDNGFRTELEVAYSQYDVRRHRNLSVGGTEIDGLDVSVLTRGAPAAGNPTVGQVINDGRGKVKNLGAFANVFYDFNRAEAFQPYLGAGLGVQRVDVEYRPSGVDVANDDQTRFAYQFMAGATYQVSPRVDLFAQYTYRRTEGRANVDLNLLPARLGVESNQSIVGAGLRFKLN
ncbi:outer membrane beta-barrel protein [uncultured Sphingomonas sp.]|jgi:opacity protein-like surface antigen|uniref:outer membrane beta-barrel protein n=1 Tax=uncultured Sphingomonas sp. TaxID=158754 RepID=UPI0016423670|nr:outer membrane beta-barrel protein [uncultured Sphingomonas sp.]